MKQSHFSAGLYSPILQAALGKLDAEWYQHRVFTGAPSLNRLWALAVHQRNKNMQGMSYYELLRLFYEALDHSLAKFDPTCKPNPKRKPKNGEPGRRTVEDRFVWFFLRKLCWLMEDQRRKYFSVADRSNHRSQYLPNHRLIHQVHEALDMLAPEERDILYCRYWLSFSHEEVAKRFGWVNRFRARNRLNQVHRKMRQILMR
jgi:Sigma-70, region 4